MRCNKHPADFSSAVGVCASCLRERLLTIMAAQAQAQLMQTQLQLGQDRGGDCRKSDTTHHPPSLAFPRSVSPYISRRKSDNDAAWQIQGHHDQRFYSTPQVGPTGSITVEIEKSRRSNGRRFFSLLSGLFKSKRGKTGTSAPGIISDPRVSGSVPGFSTRDPSTSSPSWSSSTLPIRRKKKVNTFPIDVSVTGDRRRTCKNRGRGLSPARFSDDEDDEHCRGGSSGYSSESSQGWMQTPRRTPASTRGGGGRAAAPNKNLSGLTFCMSPLVRASPNRHRGQKGVPPELVTAGALGGDARAPPKPNLSTASSFCKNRSRKLADFGRYNPNY